MKRSLKLLYPFIMIIISITMVTSSITTTPSKITNESNSRLNKISTYQPAFSVYNTKEQMTLSPIFTPNNALDTYIYWIGKANTSIHIQNPYITKFTSTAWPNASPIVSAIVNASKRGVTDIEIQVNKGSDTDNVTAYFKSIGIAIRYMGSSASAVGGSYISTTHNKLMIIDDKITIISSINFSGNAFLNNREAGMVVQNAHVSSTYEAVFQSDWSDGELPAYNNINVNTVVEGNKVESSQSTSYYSPFAIPKENFTGVYNVSVFTNPDNADKFIFKYLLSAKKSIYVSMYTISKPDFNNTLITLKKANPLLDIQVLVTRDHVDKAEDIDTTQAMRSLVANLIPVYNSSSDLNYYHNKYWVIDGNDTFVYSGNWSPASVTPNATSYASGTPNRDMGIAVLDAPDVANFFTNQVWKKDVAIATPWTLPSGVKQQSFVTGAVISGTVKLQATVSNLNDTTFYYKWNNDQYVEGSLTNNHFSFTYDTKLLANGVNTFTVKVVTNSLLEFTDSVKVTVANYPSYINWRVLLTEVLANPNTTSDALGEFYEITNSFPFDVLLGGWSTGVKDNSFNFPSDYVIPAYTSIIFARDATGFQQAFSVTPDFSYTFSLVNSADYVYLKNASGSYIDVIAYGMTAPDGSETLTPATSGLSIQRSPPYIDTNTIADFITALPTAKVQVSHVALTETGIGSNNESSTASISLEFILLPMILMALVVNFSKNKRKN